MPAKSSASPAFPATASPSCWPLSAGERPVEDNQAIWLEGQPVGAMNAALRRRRGLTYVPEDRLGRGAVPPDEPDPQRPAHRARPGHGAHGNGDPRRVPRATSPRECIREYDVRCPGTRGLGAQSLSGGNLQKFILGREIDQEPKVLILAQPTWGVDVAASAAIRQAVIDLAARGVAVLVVSEELSEIFEICDRIAVMAGGRLAPARDVADTNASEIGRWMAGMFPGGGRRRLQATAEAAADARDDPEP